MEVIDGVMELQNLKMKKNPPALIKRKGEGAR